MASHPKKADVYSFGLILWEMLSLRRPFEGLNRKEFVQTVIKGGRRPPLQQEWSGALRELMRRCWDEDMDVRPGEEREEKRHARVLSRRVAFPCFFLAAAALPPSILGLGFMLGCFGSHGGETRYQTNPPLGPYSREIDLPS